MSCKGNGNLVHGFLMQWAAVRTTSDATNVPVQREVILAANIDLADGVPRWAPRVDTHAVIFANYAWVQILSRCRSAPENSESTVQSWNIALHRPPS